MISKVAFLVKKNNTIGYKYSLRYQGFSPTKQLFRNFTLMKQVFHKIMAISMALLLLLSTISWKVEKHYCMGRLMDVALFVDVDTCGMDMSLSVTEENLFKTKPSCCDDEVIFVDGQDDLKISFNELDLENQSLMIGFLFSYTKVLQDIKEQPVPHEKYPPPNLVKDIQLLDEVFII